MAGTVTAWKEGAGLMISAVQVISQERSSLGRGGGAELPMISVGPLCQIHAICRPSREELLAQPSLPVSKRWYLGLRAQSLMLLPRPASHRCSTGSGTNISWLPMAASAAALAAEMTEEHLMLAQLQTAVQKDS